MRENKFRNQSAGAKQLEAYSFMQAFYIVVFWRTLLAFYIIMQQPIKVFHN